MTRKDVDVLIVGGGPTGLFLGSLFIGAGYSCRVLEKRIEPTTHSRSIGIHPPSLVRLNTIGVVERILEKGMVVRSGRAYVGGKLMGTISFEKCPLPYQFLVAIPQFETEAILESRLRELDPDALLRRMNVVDIVQSETHVRVVAQSDSRSNEWSAKFVIGCDGKNSTVRNSEGMAFPGGDYPNTYAMGDFEDSTGFGQEAAIYIGIDGVVESFPLPGGVRRWVVKTDGLLPGPEPTKITKLVEGRTGISVDPATCTMTSAFNVSRYLTPQMTKGRILLAGDAAHIVSPIGGQGMNLGWLDAYAVLEALESVRKGDATHHAALLRYSKSRRRAARIAMWRSELNMWLGSNTRHVGLRKLAVAAVLSPPLRGFFAKQFTMQKLG